MNNDDPHNFEEALEGAKTMAGLNGFQAYADEVSNRRKYCSEKGQHILSGTREEFDAQDGGETRVCLHCEVLLDKNLWLEQEAGGTKLVFSDDE